MKKLYSLFLLLTGLLCFTSCGDDDYTYTAPETLNVTKADLYFTSSGGTGNIEIKSNSGLRATSSVDWCTVSVSGGVITATVVENVSLESRAGTITVNDGTLSSLVAVYQEGLAFIIDMSAFQKVNPNTAGSTSVIVDSSSPYTVTISSFASSWLSYTSEDGEVTFNLAANTTGVPRGAYVTIVSGPKTSTFLIAQYDIESLVGTWNATYSDGDAPCEEEMEITKLDDGMLELNFKLPIANVTPVFQCTHTDGVIKSKNGIAQGRYSTYYLFSSVITEEKYMTVGTNVTYSGSIDITEDGTFRFKFHDDGSWPNRVVKGLAIGAFSSSTPSDSNLGGYIALYLDLILQK